jgi:hypothetical protein
MNKLRKYAKVAANIAGVICIICWGIFLITALIDAENKANDPNTPPAERERIKREITAALHNMG